MKTDYQIQKDVMDELKWQPFLNSSQIGVAVKEGVVTLSGIVDNYTKKIEAEKAAKSVSGVKAVAEDIQVGLSPSYRKTDAEIATAVVNALRWQSAFDENKLKIKVEDGVVKLEGQVDWAYQRTIAKTAIQNLTGVKAVINLVTLKQTVAAADVEKKITSAFQRNAALDAAKIAANVSGETVTLRGTVRSFTEKEDAENAAWAAPGIYSVVNNLEIEEPEYAF